VNRRLGAAAQQEDDKKNRNRNTYPPCAMAPIVSATKPAATAIATFNSIDNFIISHSIMAAPSPPLLLIPFFLTVSNLSALVDVRGRPQSPKARARWTFAVRITCCTDDASGLDDGSREKNEYEKVSWP
jgi:hypothetical protein